MHMVIDSHKHRDGTCYCPQAQCSGIPLPVKEGHAVAAKAWTGVDGLYYVTHAMVFMFCIALVIVMAW
jgi:hypothetical protein